MYALVPRFSMIPRQTWSEAEVASAGSFAILLRALAVIGGAGLVASFVVRGLPLHNRLERLGIGE